MEAEATVTRYESGARYERKAKAELEAKGYIVTRAAGSRGAADLVAVKVRHIQVKACREPQAWTGELEKVKAELPSGPGVTRELWVWNKGCGWEKHLVEED